MAKKPAPQDAAPEDAAAPGVPQIKIQGIMFPVAPKYSEGHVLTSQEADTLNQTRAENLRNNFAARIKKLTDKLDEEAKAAGVEPRALNEAEISALQTEFAEYAATYTFSAPRPGRAPADPLEREMRVVAKELILDALRRKNVSVRSLPEGKMDELIQQLIANKPVVREEAEKRLAARKGVADDILGI